MKKRTALRALAILLMLLMLTPHIASCNNKKTPVETPNSSDSSASEDTPDSPHSSASEGTPDSTHSSASEATADSTASESGGSESNNSQATTAPADKQEDTITLVNSSKAIYSVVCPASLNDVCSEFVLYAYESCKKSPSIVRESQEDACEIIVGEIDCEAVKAVKASAALSAGDFVIRVVNKKIVILGFDEEATKTAFDYFVNKVITYSSKTKAVYMNKEYSFVYDKDSTNAVSVLSKENSFLVFSLNQGSTKETFVRLSYTGNWGWRIQTKLRASDAFDDMGASQRLSVSIGEDPVLTAAGLTYTTTASSLKISEAGGSYAILNLASFSISFYSASGRSANTVVELSANETQSIISTELTENEVIFGGGSLTTIANHRGELLEIYTYDRWDKANQCYLAVPLFSSSRGSGIFINRYEHMVADIGKTHMDKMTATVENAMMDCYIFASESIQDVLYGYCSLSGFPKAPEDWAYGIMFCRYWREFYPKFDLPTIDPSAVNKMIENMDKYELPWDGIIMEGWDSDDERLYEEWKKIIDAVHARGKKVLCYIYAGDMPDNAPEAYYLTYTDAQGNKRKDFDRVVDGSGGMANPDTEENEKMYYLDITNPNAVDWYFNIFWDHLFNELGIDGAKIDFCELLPENYEINYHDKTMATEGSHHWYPTAFCTMFYENVSSKPDGGLVFVRGGGIGSQRNPFMWAGDQTRQQDRLQRQLNLLISSGLSGVPFQSFDMAGYRYANETAKLSIEEEARIFVRGAEFTAFTPCMQTHGKDVLAPYAFAEQGFTSATDLYRIYSRLHEALIPYTSEMGDIAEKTGMPLVRHLALHWQDDMKVYGYENEYMYGDAFLVAPELKGNLSRNIYLPEGEWINLNTGEEITVGAEGKWMSNCAVSMSQLPVFYNKNTASKTAPGLVPSITALLREASAIEFKPD